MSSDVQPFHSIYLNSVYASGDPWNHTYILPGNFMPFPSRSGTGTSNGKKVRFGLLSATFPGAYPNVNSLNNTIVFREVDNLGVATDFTITIPAGTYTDVSLAAEIETLMDAASTLDYTVTQAGGVLTFAVADPNYTITLLVDDPSFTAEQLLGLSTPNPTFDSATPFTATFQINLLDYYSSTEVIIRCSSLTCSTYEARLKGSSNIFAICQNTITNDDSNLIYQSPFPKILVDVEYNPSQLSFQITDTSGRLLEGLRGPVTMLIGCYYYD